MKEEAVWRHGRDSGARVLVETGTYHGAMLTAVRHGFDRLVSIELDDELFDRAAGRFSDDPDVTILHGDSAELLPEVVAGLSEPAVFWLDGHYSGEGTAYSEVPLVSEVRAILAAPFPHVVLIDDAIDVAEHAEYPGIDELRDTVSTMRPGHSFTIRDNVIRIHP